MKNVLKALSNARHYCYRNNIEKKGKNNYSNYEYFTPEQIYQITSEAEKENGLLSVFDLISEDNIEMGFLTIYHIDSGEKIVFKMRTAIPEIKATNLTQQLGGAVTYTHRYLLTTAYKIAENHLDFDSDEQSKKKKKEPEKNSEKKPEKSWLNIYTSKQQTELTKVFEKAHKFLHEQNGNIDDIKKKYKLSKETENALKSVKFINEFKENETIEVSKNELLNG